MSSSPEPVDLAEELAVDGFIRSVQPDPKTLTLVVRHFWAGGRYWRSEVSPKLFGQADVVVTEMRCDSRAGHAHAQPHPDGSRGNRQHHHHVGPGMPPPVPALDDPAPCLFEPDDGWSRGWSYHSMRDAVRAALRWDPATEAEPFGWHRALTTDTQGQPMRRRRPDGDPLREHPDGEWLDLDQTISVRADGIQYITCALPGCGVEMRMARPSVDEYEDPQRKVFRLQFCTMEHRNQYEARTRPPAIVSGPSVSRGSLTDDGEMFVVDEYRRPGQLIQNAVLVSNAGDEVGVRIAVRADGIDVLGEVSFPGSGDPTGEYLELRMPDGAVVAWHRSEQPVGLGDTYTLRHLRWTLPPF